MIDYALDDQGIVTLTWDLAADRQHADPAERCATCLATLERATADAAVKGILMTVVNTDSSVGSSLESELADDPAEELFGRTMALHRALRKLERCGKPVAAALSGSALGVGLEIALAAHYRVASDRPLPRFGLPAVTLGLIPGAGGTQRLARLIGIQHSLPLLLDGKTFNASDALTRGLLHAVVPAGSEAPAARAWLLAQTTPVQQPWDTQGYRIPGGAVSSPAVQQLLMVSNAMVRVKPAGPAPAPANLLSCVYEGLITDIDTGLKTEARYFVHTLLSHRARRQKAA
jgi:3-hydroxyacyl-CoA dehydrogenase/enoyl-CoA hydratase/3-hydroxybutyryl-CoA epimerase